MACLIFACCNCDRVPALLFTRPYSSRRRWNSQGEIEVADPPPADAIPQWPLNTFVDGTELPSRGWGGFLEGSREGSLSSVALGLPQRLSPDIERLRQQSVISTELEGENLFFRMAGSLREEIWEQTCTQDRLLLWFDLLKLTIYSSPDVYAEIFWQDVLRTFKPVIDSTLLPFLSVLEWAHLQHHQAIIPRLLWFLLQYSIFDGFSVDTCIFLAPDPVQHMKFSCGLAVEKMIELLEFKENLCLHLLYLHKKDRKSPDDLLGASLGTTKLYGILGFLIASVLNSKQASQYPNEMIAIAHCWRERQGRFYSTMSTLAQNVLFTDELSNQGSRLSNHLGKADMQVKFTMATAMIERNHYAQAYAFLTSCANDLRSTDSMYEDEYFPVMTELVKCCSILNLEEQGEMTALEAMQHRYSDTTKQNEIRYLQVAFADSLIGQSKYSEAEKVLKKVLASKSLSTYLEIVASLRLNKVRRRLGVLNVSAFTYDGALQKQLRYVSDTKDHIRNECLEELSSTISFTQQRTTENVAVAKAVLDTASAIVDRGPISTSNWRTRVLHEQIAYESGHKAHEEQFSHQNPAKRSIDVTNLAVQCARVAKRLAELAELFKPAERFKSAEWFQLARQLKEIMARADYVPKDKDILTQRLELFLETVASVLDALEKRLQWYNISNMELVWNESVIQDHKNRVESLVAPTNLLLQRILRLYPPSTLSSRPSTFRDRTISEDPLGVLAQSTI